MSALIAVLLLVAALVRCGGAPGDAGRDIGALPDSASRDDGVRLSDVLDPDSALRDADALAPETDSSGGSVCGPPVVVSTKEELLAVIEQLEWVYSNPWDSPRDERPSPNIEPRGRIELEREDVPLPAICSSAPWYCKPTVAFEGEESDSRLVITSTTRLVGTLQDSQFERNEFVAVLSRSVSCHEECAPGTRRCGLDCVAPANACRGCGGSVEVCACRDGEERLPDGTACEFQVWWYTFCTGTCQSGRCRSDESTIDCQEDYP